MKKVLSFLGSNIIFIIVIVLLVGFKLLYDPVKVHGKSMEPNLKNGTICLTETAENLKIGDVVTVQIEKDVVYIKRIIGTPGDTVLIKEGSIYINGKELLESYDSVPLDSDEYLEVTLGENEYFILGDNRQNSRDSRVIGPVDKKQILRKVTYCLNL